MSATTMRSGSGGNRQQQQQWIKSPTGSSSSSNGPYGRYYAHQTGNVNNNVRRLNANSTSSTTSSTFLQRSTSADNVQIVRQRGFKPSDRHDPAKRNFLESLTSKILHFDMESGSSSPIDLQKLLTPASDSSETLHLRNKKMYASSYFYAPSHPTVEDQVELARRISNSLSDIKNVKSKGQSMYVNRKKRSVKWIHDGNGEEEQEHEESCIQARDKLPLKCMMNPSGKLLDYRGVQALGEEPNIPQVPPHPERLYDIVRDLNNHKGRGAEIFAKRRKRSEKWVVEQQQPEQQQHQQQNDRLLIDEPVLSSPVKPPSLYDLPPMDYASPALPNYGHPYAAYAPYGGPWPYAPPYGHPYAAYPSPICAPGPCHEPRKKKQQVRNDDGCRKIPRAAPAIAKSSSAYSNGTRNGFNYLNGCHNGQNGHATRQSERTKHNKQQVVEQQLEDLEDYTPVPVKQLIQEFEKTCRPVMQLKHYPSRSASLVNPAALNAADLSRYFDPRRQVCYRQQNNGYAASSAGDDEQDDDDDEQFDRRDYDDEEDDDDDDEDASLDDSLSPVDLYPTSVPVQVNNNRSSSMSTIDDYYRRQQQTKAPTYVDTEAEPLPASRAADLAVAVTHSQIVAQKKQLNKTPVLENLVAGTTTPECFKEAFTEEIACKLSDNLYHGPKISSYQNLTNYNTAPRGWDQSQKVYRPIRFEKPLDTKISYSDF